MRFLIALLAVRIFAAPTVSSIQVDAIGWSTARVQWTISGGTPSNYIQRIRYGFTTSYEAGAGGGIQHQRNLAISPYQMALSGLKPATEYNICPQVSDDAGATWSTCVNATFTTLAKPAGSPLPPVAPESFSAVYPNTTGYTVRNVASDCSDLQTHINTAVTNQSTAGSVINIPAGTTCTGTYTTPTDPAAKSFTTANVNTTTERITVTGHGWSNGQQIRFAKGGCLPGSSPGVPDAFCQSRGPIIMGRVYYVVGSATNDFQVSLTSGGAAIDLTDQGSGTNYVIPWPPAHSNEVIIRTATADSNFAPSGTRLRGSAWASKMAKLQITGGTWSFPTMAFTPGIGAHHIRLMGLEITHSDASANLSGSVDPRPTYGLVNLAPENALGYITLDRVWLHGLGYPNRIYRPILQWDGKYMAIIDSDFTEWNYWRPGKTGLTPTLATQTVTIATGSTYLRANQACTAASPVTFTRTGGTTNATSKIYVTTNCTPTIEVPTGTTATCAGSMTDHTATSRPCAVSVVTTPATPVDGFGGFAALPLANVDASGGVWSSATDTYYGTAPSIYITEGTQGMIGGWGPGPYLFENNYSQGEGLLWHFDDGAKNASIGSGYTLRRNTFRTDPTHKSNAVGANGLRYMQRNGVEWKNGTNILIEGNTWDGFWADVSATGCAIVLTGVSGWVSDADIRHNTMNGSACFLIAIGGLPDPAGVAKPFQHLRVSNNLINMTNGWTQAESQSRATASAFPFYLGMGMEDIIIDHNTLYDNRGPLNQMFHWLSSPTAGVSVTNNIFWMNNDYPVYGFAAELGSANLFAPACSGTAKEVMDCLWREGAGAPAYTFARNLLVPYYTNSATQTGLVDLNTTATQYSGLSPYIITGGDIATRLANVGFFTSGTDFRLRASSAYQSGGASNGRDGLALGADIDALRAAQGQVYNVRVLSITSSAATVYFTAPDSTGCTVDYSTASGLPTFTRVANAGGSRLQSVALSGLSTGTRYYYRVNCAVEQPTADFLTQ